MSLRRRLTLVSAGAVAVTVVGLALAAYLLVGGMLRDQVDDSLRGAAAITDDRIIERLPTRPPPIPREADRIRIPGPFLAARLITEDGEATRQFGGEVTFPTPAAAREIARQPEGTLRIIDAEGDDGRSLRLLMKSLGEGRAVVVARDTQEMDTLLDRLRWVLIGLGVAGVLAAGILGRVVSGTAMRPLERLRAAVDHVGRTGDLTRRVPEDGPAELRDVAVRFNRMLERLEASTTALDASARAQRRLVADASHELRTPIAVLRTNIEVLQAAPELAGGEREAMLGEVDEQLQELGGLVSDLIELARAVRNLLDNAVKFSPPGGVVEVRVADGVISVRDHGRGIAEDDLPHVFDRFWRADGARDVPGSGLGLAIVRQTVEAHGGEVVVDGAVPGGGARFEIRLTGATAPIAVS